MRLFLLRHAQAISSTLADGAILPDDADNPLTASGEQEAASIARHLRQTCASPRVVASPMPRAAQTAAIIQAELACKLDLDRRLEERAMGFTSATTVAESRVMQEACYKNIDLVPSNGESVTQHASRICVWLQAVEVQRQLAGDLIAVTHGGTIELVQLLLFRSDLAAAMPSAFTRCDTAHYHLWTSLSGDDGRDVWRLDGINLGA